MIQKYDSMNPRVGLQIRGRGKTTSTDDKVKHKYRGKKKPHCSGGGGGRAAGLKMFQEDKHFSIRCKDINEKKGKMFSTIASKFFGTH
jgi:hypothetical protein